MRNGIPVAAGLLASAVFSSFSVADDAALEPQVEGAQELAIGINWTITPQLKVFTNCTHTRFDGGSGAADRADEEAVFTRLQLNF